MFESFEHLKQNVHAMIRRADSHSHHVHGEIGRMQHGGNQGSYLYQYMRRRQ